jgi:Rad3-related DNA helicase
MMSATILDSETFSQDIGLDSNDVKVIKVGSTFPIENRQIHPLNIAKLNRDSWAREEVKLAIVRAIDKVMSHFKDLKGLIHCTSYDQLNFIMTNISQENKRRLLKTDPNIERDLVIEKHIDSSEPTVLISPSLHLGLDLKDDLSRFQIIVKIPYANLGDRWINAKRNRPGGDRWYNWLSALHTVQACGRSIRHDTDWAYTFCLDSGFAWFIKMNHSILPGWFLESIKWR